MFAEPQKEHAWLHKLVGAWTYESEACGAPDQPSMKASGTEIVRSIGGLWIVGEGSGVMPDGKPATMIITLGYDPHKRRFVGTWIGSMMTHLWNYDGALDASGRVLTLSAEGPSMSGDGGMTKYQDIVEIVSDSERLLKARMLNADGSWSEIMTAHYRRP